MRSSTVSIPTDSRMTSGPAPAAIRSSSDSCRCVVDAGWRIRLRVSPTLARWDHSSTLSTTRMPASKPPRTPNVNTEPGPSGRYRAASAWDGLDGRPAYDTQATAGWPSRNSATRRAFATWRSMRSGSVSVPVRMWNALVGDRVGPRSRRATARAFIENPKSPKVSMKSSPW